MNKLLARLGLLGGADDDRRVIRGRVIGARSGQLVRAYDKSMRSEELLGEATTDASGVYEITYTRARPARADKKMVDLRVTVLNHAGGEVASTPVIFSAAPVEVAPDLALELSEYERLTAELRPLMRDVEFEELTADDVAFLTRQTGIEAEQITWLAEAAGRARDVGADRGSRVKPIPAEAFYGLFRKEIPTELEALLRTPLETLRAAFEAAVAEIIVPATLRDQVDEILKTLQALQVELTLAPAKDDEPPSLGDLIGALPERLEPGRETALAAAVGPGGIDSLREEQLDDLVRRRKLTRAQADDIALAAVAFHLADGSSAITQGLLGLTSGAADEPRVHTVADLARLDEEDWRAVVKDADVDLPPGKTIDGFAQELTSRVTRVLPSDFLAHRVTAVPDDLASLVEDASDASPPEALVRLARRNPGLDLEEVLAGSGAARTKAKNIERLVGLVADTWSRNPGTNLLELDHSPDSADIKSLKLPDVDDVDREKILRNLRAHQRAFRAGRDAGTALKLLDGGFDAARKIVALNPDEFVNASGLPPEQAVAVHYAATKASMDAAVKSVALYQMVKSHAPASARTSADARDFIAQIPGYSTLFPDDFGFCDCEDCGSVLGLPAYFVDLMFFVEQHILDYLPANLSIHLKARRDDLWTLDLTCAHANEVLAYLDVVNEILEKHVSKQLGLPQGGDVWEKIAEKNPSFALPFNLPLTRIETYLGHFGKRRLDAAVACGSDEAVRARAQLGLSQVEAEVITTAAATNFSALTAGERTFLSKLYGYLEVYQNGRVETSGFSIVFVSNVLDASGASREALGELLATKFVAGTAAPTIRAGRSTPQSLQNDTEVIEGLNAGHLDRLHRLYRLSRHVPWTIPEVDRTLGRLTKSGVSSELGDTALLRIARLLDHQEQLGLSVEELCGLWTELPNDQIDGGPGLFDALFNPPQLASLGTPLEYKSNPQGSFQHPSFNTTGTSLPQDDNTLARLLAGLRVSDE
ncbi:MAG TPA: Tc toxin subunit A, partial [Gaiellaceae bacterium]|nr:Tc toxin subunit A [Gaiellaceae bacterium]